MSSTEIPGIAVVPAKPTTPVGETLLVSVGGQVGAFTPLLTKSDAPIDSIAQSNGQILIDAMRAEITRLRRENETQRKKLSALKARSSAPEDLAAAVQSSVDEMQRRLASMTNPVSDFAVREFRLEATVRVDVSSLGKIQYYFVKPGEEVDPNSLSRIILDLTPIPKQQPGESVVDLHAVESVRVLPNLSEKQKALLEKNNIHTLGDFISTATRARSAVELSALLRMDRERLAACALQAEMLVIPGITADLLPSLASVGAGDAAKLGGFAPSALAERLAKLNPQVMISQEQTTVWINAAKQLFARR